MALQYSKNKKGQYRIYSTVIDKYISKWISLSEVILRLDLAIQLDAKLEIIKEYYCFPADHFCFDTMQMFPFIDTLDNAIAFKAWKSELPDDYWEYSKAINRKYRQVIKELKKRLK